MKSRTFYMVAEIQRDADGHVLPKRYVSGPYGDYLLARQVSAELGDAYHSSRLQTSRTTSKKPPRTNPKRLSTGTAAPPTDIGIIAALSSPCRLAVMGIFAEWQPVYAERGVATFPVNIDDNGKRPAVRGYLKAGKQTSSVWATKFADSNALGFAVKPNGITILDIDTPDENVLADAMSRHGRSPLIVRSQSGNWQAYYKHNGETRQVRPWRELPIDVLGDGFTVAPPSKGGKGRYEIVHGCLDDMADLPVLSDLPARERASVRATDADKTVGDGRRADDLWRVAMKAAHDCESEADLLTRARAYAAATYRPTLPDDEIRRGVASAWRYTIDGDNHMGEPHVVLTHREIDGLLVDQPDAFILLNILKRHHWARTFAIANAMADQRVVPFNRKRLSKARNYLETQGYVSKIRGHSKDHGPALYCWP